MTERLVDVLNGNGAVVHTFPITLDGSDTASDVAYKTKALEAASHAQLVPDADLKSLTARMHVCRGGVLAPYGDNRNALSETRESLEQVVRERAYFLWEVDGRSEGSADDYWHRAREQHLRERAYVLWQQDGSPGGRTEEYWHRTHDFQAY
jgi:Protein of unknown function (DUF2934)